VTDLGPLLWPNTVALVGAADDTDILRGRILNIMRHHDFAGRLFPVSRSRQTVQGLPAYASIAACPEPVELAILVIPAAAVADEMTRCGEAGVKAVLIISSGFAEEPGQSGTDMQADICRIADHYGMLVSGPNAEGFANTAAKLCATFSPTMEMDTLPLVPAWHSDDDGDDDGGHIAVVAQSGGVGFSFFDRGRARELPFSHIVTTGNEAALESLQVVDYLLDDPKTGVILMFMEDVKTPALFAPVAEKALRAGKPLIVAKVGRTDAGVRAAASHTAALAGTYSAYQAMFRRYGIIEGFDQDHMVDLAMGFSCHGQRLPAGRRVGIFTASGGAGGWLADACADAGLEVPELDPATRATIDPHLPAYGTSQNPVDGTAQTIRQRGYAEMCELIARSPEVDAVLAVTSARNPAGWEREREKLMRVGAEMQKPILLWAYTLPHPAVRELVSRAGFPLFENMRHCAEAAAAMAGYRAFREDFLKPTAASWTATTARHAAAADVLNAAGPVLCEYEARSALAAYDIGEASTALAETAEEAIIAATLSEQAVALKVQSPDILHKTEAGAIALDVRGGPQVAAAFDRVLAKARAHTPAAQIHGVLVQPMAAAGLEVIAGIHRDVQFGLMLMLGLGGVLVEAFSDVVFSPLPVSHVQAQKMIKDLKGAHLFDGVRGAASADIEALVELLVRLSVFAQDFAGQIDEIDLNPIRVHAAGEGVSVLDALIIQRRQT